MEVWRYRPQLISHTYYAKRADFVRESSAFDHWVLIGAEAGVFDYRIENQDGQATFGDLVICRPDALLWRRAQSTLSYHVLQWRWHDARGEVVEPQHELLTDKITLREVARLSSNYAALRSVADKMDDFHHSYKNHLLHDLLQMAYREVLAVRGSADGRGDELMRVAARRLQERAVEAFSMKEISDELGLSPVQFTRRFAAMWNQTPSEHLTSLRLHKARMLLMETDWTLQHIARECGYASGLYLNRVFLAKMKSTPGEFRKANRV